MEKNQQDTALDFIDEKLFEARIIQVSGSVGSVMAREVCKTLLAMEQADSKKPIFLHINSPGGEVYSGFSIYDTARYIQPQVYTIVVGLAASMGSLIALCAPKERRLALPNSKFLIHQPLIPGGIYGSASDLEIHAKDIVQTKQKINRIYADETGRPMADVERATDRDNWMTAQEAKEFGLISRIINRHEDIFKK